MFTCFERDIDSKQLYFKLSSSLQINCFDYQGNNLKFAGLYAIYKKDVCYYVGQSQNLASRISQHITGKYESADRIAIFLAKANGFSQFDGLNKETRKLILENNEKILIQELKPIENLITPDSEFELPDDKKFNVFVNVHTSDEYIYDCSCSLAINKLFIATSIYYDSDLEDVSGLDHHNKMIVDCYRSEEAFKESGGKS